MTLAKNAVDQRIRQGRQMIPHIGERLRIRQIVVDAFDPLPPLFPVLLTDVGTEKELLMSLAHHAGHARKAGRILVLLVRLQAVLAADIIEEFHALAVLLIVRCVNMYDGMQALSAAVNQGGDRKLKLTQDSILLAEFCLIGFDQGIA